MMKPACGRKTGSPALRYYGRWLVEDHGALAVALKREKARDGMEVKWHKAHRSGYI
jgi:hypothetical protein